MRDEGLAARGRRRWVPLPAHIALFLLLALGRIKDAPAQIEMPPPDPQAAITVWADQACRWRQGEYDVWHLRGSCQIQQGRTTARSDEAILLVDRAQLPRGELYKVLAYLEGRHPDGVVRVDYQRGGLPHRVTGRAANSIVDRSWLGRFHSARGLQMNVPHVAGAPPSRPAIFQRAMAAIRPAAENPVRPAQMTAPAPAGPARQPPPVGARRITVTPRSSVRIQGLTFRDPERNEQIIVINSGVRVVVEGAQAGRFGQLGRLVLETDRIVIWTSGLDGGKLSGESLQRAGTPLEFYLEGNIIFAQGDRVIYADRMYYNVPGRYGTILNAEVLTPVPDYEGLLRLKADVLQQLNEQNFIAYGAALTSSRLGVPQYWLQAENITFRDVQSPQVDPVTGQAAVDPQTGQPLVDHQLLTTSRNNFAYILGVPVFYWPVLATDLTKPFYYIDRFSVRSDSIFGTQVLTDWNAYQLLGIRNPPPGTDWKVTLDGMSARGIGFGTDFRYERGELFGLSGPTQGFFDFWGIKEEGLDDLGEDRRGVVPETDNRGRIFWRHRQRLDIGFQLTAEVGLISDRTLLEQYFEHEWDQEKDQTTGVELKQLAGDMSTSLIADVRVNDFFTQTEWLPRLDHFLLGRSILLDRVTWLAHSYVGYGRFETADPPTVAPLTGQFRPLAWERAFDGTPFRAVEGVRAGTRQELDLPFSLGPVRLVPYALGDVTHWGEDRNGGDVTRTYGQLGVRASLPLWRADPSVQSLLLNLNGLAHKVVLDAEFFWADANRDLNRFPLYDPLDEDAQEFFRRRFFIPTGPFPGAGAVPLRFDERFYGLRSGLQSWVTAPSAEIADDLMLARLGVRQRWQTKRGLAGQERIVDWITLDVEGAYFPRARRDNFGADIGLANYDFRWHVGDRLTLLSDGYFDFFSQGLRTVSLGGLMSRPEVGSLYLGFRSMEGPITSNLLTASLSYRMSEKWIVTAGTSYDFSRTGNIGQSLAFTRIGESFLVQVGVSADVSRGSVGAILAIEPRFLPASRLGQVGGVQIPPAGARGLE